MAIAGINYDTLPVHMQQGIRLYIERGIEPGGFLLAVLNNNLVRAFARADEDNLTAMHRWASFLYNEAPSPCWGSEEKIVAWIKHNGLEGYDKREGNDNE